MSELALDDDEGNAFLRNLDGVGVPQLVRREPTSDTSDRRRSPQLLAGSRRLPMTAAVAPRMTHSNAPTGRSARSSSQGWS